MSPVPVAATSSSDRGFRGRTCARIQYPAPSYTTGARVREGTIVARTDRMTIKNMLMLGGVLAGAAYLQNKSRRDRLFGQARGVIDKAKTRASDLAHQVEARSKSFAESDALRSSTDRDTGIGATGGNGNAGYGSSGGMGGSGTYR